MSHYGYAAIGGLLLLENIGVPAIPGETALIAGAVYAGMPGHRLNVVLTGVVAVLACFAGSDIGYGAGRYGGRALVLRYGKYVRVRGHHLDRAEHLFARYGGVVVIVARFIFGLRELNGIIAGLSVMAWPRFLLCNAIGAAVWVAVWVSTGYLAGAHILAVYHNVERYSVVALIALAVFAVAFLGWMAYLHRRTQPDGTEPRRTEPNREQDT